MDTERDFSHHFQPQQHNGNNSVFARDNTARGFNSPDPCIDYDSNVNLNDRASNKPQIPKRSKRMSNLEVISKGLEGRKTTSKTETSRDSIISRTMTPILKQIKVHWGIKDVLYTLLWISCGQILPALNWSIYFVRSGSTAKSGGVKAQSVDKTLSWNNTTISDVSNTSNTFLSNINPTLVVSNTTVGNNDTIESTELGFGNVENKKASKARPRPPKKKRPPPTFYEFNLFEGDDISYTWARVSIEVLFFVPLALTISLWIFTNLTSFKGKHLVIKLTIIYLVHSALAVPYTILRLQNMINCVFLIAGTLLFHLVTVLVWWLLVKCLSIRWRISFKGLVVLQTCQAFTFIIAGLPMVMKRKYLRKIVVVIPLIMLALEIFLKFALRKAFNGHRNNVQGRTLVISSLVFPIEATRFASFLVIYIGYKHRGEPFSDLAWNVAFSVIGEIYCHSGIYQRLQTYLENRIAVIDLKDYFPEVETDFSAIRAILEYVVPTFLITNVYLAEASRQYIPKFGNYYDFVHLQISRSLLDDVWDVLGVYYTIEFIALLLCLGIAKLISHKEVSALGTLNLKTIFLMIFYVGAAVNVSITTLGFLRYFKRQR